ncbi:uncharacterized protein VTP21DRAFT_3237 [Calcarisporiella thermophila]|uniref:uncharacterized protein n=1 Tax=Calcarisporiella thermophila TaxID=911321 RepID=UPI003743C1B9
MDVASLFSVKDKVVLVTGGSRGMGEMIATGYVANGAKVYITSRSVEACDEVTERLNKLGPGKCFSIPADLHKKEEITRLVSELQKHEDHLDVLVNNAGMALSYHEFDTFKRIGWEKVMNLNLTSIFFLTQACLPLLTAKSSQANPSSVINISSVGGIGISQFASYPYTASKAALNHLTKVLAGHLGFRGITVNSIAAGLFMSKMSKDLLDSAGEVISSALPMGRIGIPEDLVGVCIYLSSRAGAYMNGAVLVLDGGALCNAAKF